MALFVINYDWKMPIRSLGLSVTDFDFDYCSQFDFSKTVEKREKLEKIDTAVDALKDRYRVNVVVVIWAEMRKLCIK